MLIAVPPPPPLTGSQYQDVPESVLWFQTVKREFVRVVGDVDANVQDPVHRYLAKRGIHCMMRVISGFWCGVELPRIPWWDMTTLKFLMGHDWSSNIGDKQTVQLILPEGGVPESGKLDNAVRVRPIPPGITVELWQTDSSR